MTDLRRYLVSPADSIRAVMTCIDRNAKGIALVVDQDQRLIATVTDGDIRRAILAGMGLDLTIQSLFGRQEPSLNPQPFTSRAGTADAELIRQMNERALRHVPLVDEDGRVVDLAVLTDLLKQYELPLVAVVMAGGYGTRLRPLTENLPKPMLPVGDRPLMEHIVAQLRNAGIRQVSITTHYKPETIIQHFGNGERFGVEINYVNEDRPLGTAGALGLMQFSDEPILVINGDIVTKVDFRAMLDFHREHRAEMTVAVKRYDLQVPYGVIECDGPRVQRVREKPSYSFLVNAGIYLLEPIALRNIVSNQRFDMPELIQRLIDKGQDVISFPIVEYWLDIGQHADYERAQRDIREGKVVE